MTSHPDIRNGGGYGRVGGVGAGREEGGIDPEVEEVKEQKDIGGA